jgi:hypothetical protein
MFRPLRSAHLGPQNQSLRANKGDLTMFSKVLAAVFVLVFFTPRSLPQSTFGDVVGVVKDPSQKAVPGAQVVLTSLEDKSEPPTTTDADGAFHLVNLKPATTTSSSVLLVSRNSRFRLLSWMPARRSVLMCP